MLGALAFHRERVSGRKPITREAVVTVGDRLDPRPDVCSEEVHVGNVAGVVSPHQRLQAATHRPLSSAKLARYYTSREFCWGQWRS